MFSVYELDSSNQGSRRRYNPEKRVKDGKVQVKGRGARHGTLVWYKRKNWAEGRPSQVYFV